MIRLKRQMFLRHIFLAVIGPFFWPLQITKHIYDLIFNVVSQNTTVTDVDNFLKSIANDYQFDHTSLDYCGFLNINPKEHSPAALEFINNVPKYKLLMNKYNLTLEGGYDEEEAVFIHKSNV